MNDKNPSYLEAWNSHGDERSLEITRGEILDTYDNSGETAQKGAAPTIPGQGPRHWEVPFCGRADYANLMDARHEREHEVVRLNSFSDWIQRFVDGSHPGDVVGFMIVAIILCGVICFALERGWLGR
jgi:hypothetical protein